MSGALEDLREKVSQEIRGLDERISVEEVELLGKKQAMKELLKERRKTKVEEWTDTVLPGVRSPRWQQLGLEAPKLRVISFCPTSEFFQEIRRKIRDPLAKSRRRRRKAEQ